MSHNTRRFSLSLVSSLRPASPPCFAPFAGPRQLEHTACDFVRLLRLLRVYRLLHQLDQLAHLQKFGNVLRLMQYLMSFVTIGHWFGCAYFAVAISPVYNRNDAMGDDDWVWLDDSEEDTRVLYICSLYWAMSVMTNLKGLPAHESRQCFINNPHVKCAHAPHALACPRWTKARDVPPHSPLTTTSRSPHLLARFAFERLFFSGRHPFEERLFTIGVFLCGAITYASLYGNIGLIIQNLDASGQRFRRSMQEMNEFFRFHSVPPSLQKRIKDYMEFSFSVTRGIDVEAIHSQLPAQLQLEVSVYLNTCMLEQVCAHACRLRRTALSHRSHPSCAGAHLCGSACVVHQEPGDAHAPAHLPRGRLRLHRR